MDDFCSWYLELIKPDYTEGQPSAIDSRTISATIIFFENILKILHPFMPFISEELWHLIKDRKNNDDIIIAQWPETIKSDQTILQQFEISQSLVTEIRNYRKQKNISPKEAFDVKLKSTADDNTLGQFENAVIRLANLSSLLYIKEKPANSGSFMVGLTEVFIPYNDAIDKDAERLRLEKELEYARGFLDSVMSKLGNKKFISNAKPEIVESENKKKRDAEQKIKSLEEALSTL